MITDILDMGEKSNLRGQVVVVGSGIAGSEVAIHLSRNGREVILLESGRGPFDPSIQALNTVNFTGKPHRKLDPDANYHRFLPPELRGTSRLRQFGGTSNIWTGKWKYLEPSQFGGRDWIPNSDWPIDFDDLLPYYNSAAKDYGFGDLQAESIRPEIREFRSKLAEHGLRLSSFYWEEKPTRTAIRFGEEMGRSENLRVVLGASATELRLDDSGQRVKAVVCRSLEGKKITVEGDEIILAMGALETARLLLSSDLQLPGGIGNAHDLVGRFYTDHLKHHTGKLWPGQLTQKYARQMQFKQKPRFCVCFSIDEATQREQKLLEHALYLKPLYEKSMEIVPGRPTAQDNYGLVVAYRVNLAFEHVPHKESRLTLGTERDALGQRKLDVNWCFTEQDRESLPKIVEILSRRVEESGLGTIEFGEELPSIENMTDAAHQMGTTRMASCPEEGVVDTNCRVFGTDNLYVASSAVFPTGPSYSPTFTILALARRLGQHLLQKTPAKVVELSK